MLKLKTTYALFGFVDSLSYMYVQKKKHAKVLNVDFQLVCQIRSVKKLILCASNKMTKLLIWTVGNQRSHNSWCTVKYGKHNTEVFCGDLEWYLINCLILPTNCLVLLFTKKVEFNILSTWNGKSLMVFLSAFR